MSRAPVLFVGHGSPMNVISNTKWSEGFRNLSNLFEKPSAILAISAHWRVQGSWVSSNAHPSTMHDFGGFPDALHKIKYPAPGEPALARRVSKLLAKHRGQTNSDWGLDHGVWSVLFHMYPKADIPVVQMSLNSRLAPHEHLAIGKALAALRDDNILILASGNLTHNLPHATQSKPNTPTPPWASAFDTEIARILSKREDENLLEALQSENGRAAHPTPDHFEPIYYAYGASNENDAIGFPVTGFDSSSLSMRSVIWKP